MSVAIARWSLADYHAMIRAGILDNRQIELLNGLMVEMAPEGPEHADCSTRLMPLLWQAAQGRYQVRAAKPISLPAPAPALGESEPEPDLALVRDRPYHQAHPTAADIFLVIEVSLSSLSKDLDDKRLVYAQAGIPEYWVINLRDRHVQVYRHPASGDYQQHSIQASGVLSPLAFPDIVLPLETFFL